MTGPHGRVVAITAHRALIEVNPGFSCSRCAAGRGCGAALLAGNRHRKAILLPVKRRPDHRLEQSVSLSMGVGTMATMGAQAYGIGLAGLMAGLAGAQLAGAGDVVSAVVGLVGLGGGLAAGRAYLKRKADPQLSSRACIAAPDMPIDARLQ